MFCSKCGAQMDETAVACPKCGAPVAAPARTEEIPNYLIWAILTALFCCQIGGIVAIVYSCQVNTKVARGDIEGARRASKNAKTWVIVNACVGVAILVAYLAIGIVGAVSTAG